MLTYFFADEASIPAEHKPLYENRDGGWWLKVTGVVPKEKHDAMRTKVEGLDTELKALKLEMKKFEGVDPEKYHELKLREQEIMDAKLIKNDKVEELINQRLAGVKDENARQMKAKDDAIAEKDLKIAALTASLKKVKIDNVLLKEASERGIEPGADVFLLAASEKDWDLDEAGNPIVKGADGKLRYGKDGDPMKPGEWMDELAAKSPFMFKGNTGSGAQSRADASGRVTNHSSDATLNPWKTEHWNLTKQMEIYNKDAALAQRMALQAGKTLTQAPPPPVSPGAAPIGMFPGGVVK